MRTLILALVLALQGCSTVLIVNPDHVYNWKKTRGALPYTTHIVPQLAVEAYCSQAKTMAYGCAIWDHEQCWIMASSEWNLKMTLHHEIKHCEGWEHQII